MNDKAHFSTNISAELILALGASDFILQLDKMLSQLLMFDHVTLYVFDAKLVPHFVSGSSHGKRELTSKVSQIYKKSFYYHSDPNTKFIGGSDEKNEALIQQLHAKDIEDDAYRKAIYELNNLSDKISLIDHELQKWFILNLYRCTSSGYFNEQNLSAFRQSSVIISALIKRHLSITSSLNWQSETVPAIFELESLITHLSDELSQREIEVCARVMQGMTREGVSLDLKLKPPTIATYMGRAYAKLNISSLNELFALCLAQLSPR